MSGNCQGILNQLKCGNPDITCTLISGLHLEQTDSCQTHEHTYMYVYMYVCVSVQRLNVGSRG